MPGRVQHVEGATLGEPALARRSAEHEAGLAMFRERATPSGTSCPPRTARPARRRARGCAPRACSSPGVSRVRRNPSSARSGFATGTASVVAEQVEILLRDERHRADLAQPRADERVLGACGEGGVVRQPARDAARAAASSQPGRSPGSARSPRSGRPRGRCRSGTRAPRPRSPRTPPGAPCPACRTRAAASAASTG